MRQVREEVLHARVVDGGLFGALPFREVGQEASRPVEIRGFGAQGVAARADAAPHQLERGERPNAAALADRRQTFHLVPVRPLQEVHEVQTECVLSLAYLPVFSTTVPTQPFAVVAHPVCERPVRHGPGKELPHPAHAVPCGLLLHEPASKQELAKRLEGRFNLSRRHAAAGSCAAGA